MMKNVTIITFDEMDAIISDINNMIDTATDGAYEKFNAKDICNWLIKDLKELKNRFE